LGRRIEVAAQALEREVHLVRVRKAGRAAIQHVLEKMGEPVSRGALETRSDADVERDVRAMKLRLRSHRDDEAVRERLEPRSRRPP
jgi:hypothetical protein